MGRPTRVLRGSAGPKRLDRASIVDAAIRFIDRDGAQSLTMRGLAHDLTAGPMALYRYVSGREDLLEAVVAQLLEGVRLAVNAKPAQTWQGYLQVLARAVRGVAVDHARAFPLVATRHPAAPWLRPPLRNLDLVEDFLQTLAGHGFSDEQTGVVYRAFSSFLLGHLLLESATRGADTSPVELAVDEGDAAVPNRDGSQTLRGRPAVARMRPLLSQDRSEDEFETSLENLLDRLAGDLSRPNSS